METQFNIFENFRLLKNDMEKNGWIIDAFNFNYKNIDYIVLVKLYVEGEKKPDFALLKTEIIKADDANHSIEIPVNTNGFMIATKTLRQFFTIAYSENLGEILQQFNLNFSKFIPIQVSPSKSDKLKQVIIVSLSKSDKEDPNKVYCYSVIRNANKDNRLPYNDNKCRTLRPHLYSKFSAEPCISFCFSINKMDEKSDEAILLNFSKRI